MRQIRMQNLPPGPAVVVAAAVILAGCSGPRLAADTPRGVDFSGLWKLDRAASDDPQKVLEQMRAEARRIIDRQRGADGSVDSPDGTAAHGGPRPDPLRRSPMARLVNGVAARGDILTIRQSATAVSFDYGDAYRRSFTPGAHSVVSAEDGVGDQTSGWKGRDFVVVVHAQIGPDVSERYSLSRDGHLLTETLRISGGELQPVELKRLYHPADASAPAPLPTTD
ncbi:MAG: hypothetical protein JSR67_02085 [Proteobacteria bacterium]|nr:hypothetical protein [Pseudomonadota bacterium]